jgi:hypothetical protein
VIRSASSTSIIHLAGFSRDCLAVRQWTSSLIVPGKGLAQHQAQRSALDVLTEIPTRNPPPWLRIPAIRLITPKENRVWNTASTSNKSRGLVSRSIVYTSTKRPHDRLQELTVDVPHGEVMDADYAAAMVAVRTGIPLAEVTIVTISGVDEWLTSRSQVPAEPEIRGVGGPMPSAVRPTDDQPAPRWHPPCPLAPVMKTEIHFSRTKERNHHGIV